MRKDPAELNRERVKRCMATKDRINVILPQGTAERIRALGYSGNAFAKEAILKELDRMERKG
jgi:hypothetical protein